MNYGLIVFLFAVLVATAVVPEGVPPAEVWPDRDWPRADPAAHGFSRSGLAAAAEYALQHGGGSGCVIRSGWLLHEWGSPTERADIKSCTKGAVGATLLGLAVGDGLVALDDRARAHLPTLGVPPAENAATGWLDEITVRHLATMTAGFDDGRPG